MVLEDSTEPCVSAWHIVQLASLVSCTEYSAVFCKLKLQVTFDYVVSSRSRSESDFGGGLSPGLT